ncbi:putative activator of Hsp90 ATPase, N-terminal [Lyophyllum shimeji]|uniref:Activator of Hsp90 ATPase, N-terminal n=1 Tax=Lyophyllum shimeji TaxID=47721 RepID=A0A9P3UHY9_LYOSH|nr:putative activator of Hsp90 ATPase, N-terminal [Lyophyllum shimeji]
MAMPPSTANWHWKNKNVTRWAREWFERELATISVKGDKEGEVVSVSRVTDMDGDVELGQRKSKLITIYDTKIVLKWEGTASDGTEVNGTLTIPEVSHEITLDGSSNYAYKWNLTTETSPVVEALFDVAKSRLPPALEAKFAEFPVAIIETHGKDLTVSEDPSRAGTPAPAAASASAYAPGAPAASPPTQPKKAQQPKTLTTTEVTVESNFQAAADDLYSLLTDEKRIPAWTRAPAKSDPRPGGEFSLFGGGVYGKYVSLTPPREIVQSWALQSPIWPSGHTATLTTTIVQSTDSTHVTFSLAGVPAGMEEETKRNLEGYYIRGFKSIGYVQLIEYTPTYTPSSKPRATTKRTPPESRSSPSYTPAILIACLVLAAAFSIPYLSSVSSSK